LNWQSISGTRGSRPLRDDLPVAIRVEALAAAVDPVGDLHLDGLGEELLGHEARDLAEHVLDLGSGTIRVSLIEGSMVAYSCAAATRWVNLDTPRVRRLPSSRYPQHSIILLGFRLALLPVLALSALQ
jgi:hypothetical protein